MCHCVKSSQPVRSLFSSESFQNETSYIMENIAHLYFSHGNIQPAFQEESSADCIRGTPGSQRCKKEGKANSFASFLTLCHYPKGGYSLGTLPAEMLVEQGVGKSVDHTCQP